MKLTTREIVLAALFTALTIVGAKINLLLPDVPVTLQPIVVMLAACLAGSKVALFSQVVYIALGLIGIPVFAKPMAGPSYIVTPTFGYLIGFAIGAYVIGFIIEKAAKKSLSVFITANMTGLAIFYFFGVLYIYILMNLYLGKPMSIMKALAIGMAPFIIKDIILGIAVSILASKVYYRINSQLRGAL